MTRSRFVTGSVAAVLSIAFVGCNSILDNNPAVLVDEKNDPALPGEPTADGGATEQPQVTPSPDGGAEPTPDSGGGGGCPAGQHQCDGVCVSLTDPLYGCGDPSCKPCPSNHSSMTCQGKQCIVASCDAGYADCNKAPGDGCEVDLSKATSCGACNAVCGAAAPLCAPSGPTFQCTNGCTPTAPLACGNDCVDPMTSVNHCGGCNVQCPAVPNATTACAVGVCTFTCKTNFHACGGKCVTRTDPTACGPDCIACPVPANGAATCQANACGFKCDPGFTKCGDKCVGPNDPSACGPACTACPAAPNATPTCNAGACGVACAAGYANCDANPANGCEAALASDPLNCGACGKSCNGQACVNGLCQAPPPPPPP